MPYRTLLHDSKKDFRCIGILLKECPIPVRQCDQCWFATDKGEPTLVRIDVFHQITATGITGEPVL